MRIKEEVRANTTPVGPEEALALAKRASKVIVASGRRATTFDMKRSPPADDELLAAILGRSGKLRAPAILKGKTLLVGFHEQAYRDVFG